MGRTTKMVEVNIDLIKPYENNAKKHGEEQLQKLQKSIQEFGFLTPCLIDKDYNLIAGHGRVMAAKELGMKSVPCVFIEGLSDDQRRAYILADNRLAELAGWDFSILDAELADINDIDMSQFGFDLNMPDFDIDSFFDEATTDDKDKKKKTITCPNCGEEIEL